MRGFVEAFDVLDQVSTAPNLERVVVSRQVREIAESLQRAIEPGPIKVKPKKSKKDSV